MDTFFIWKNTKNGHIFVGTCY